MSITWRLHCEVNDEVLQLVLAGIVVVIPQQKFWVYYIHETEYVEFDDEEL